MMTVKIRPIALSSMARNSGPRCVGCHRPGLYGRAGLCPACAADPEVLERLAPPRCGCGRLLLSLERRAEGLCGRCRQRRDERRDGRSPVRKPRGPRILVGGLTVGEKLAEAERLLAAGWVGIGPTKAQPGSALKVATLAARFAAGKRLFHRRDAA